MEVLHCSPEQWCTNETEHLGILQDSLWAQVPLLNVNELHDFKDGTLVKFRGMIQDMHGPEFYLEKFEVINEGTEERSVKCGKYRDVANCKENESINVEDPKTVTSERKTYVVISTPALNDWVKSIEEEKFKLQLNANTSTSGAGQAKRQHEEQSMETDQSECASSSEGISNNTKRQCTEIPKTPTPNLVSMDHILNFPIPDSSGRVCHVKIYDGAESLKLNDLYEFVGFLFVDPTLAYQNNDEVVDDMEFQTHNPPSSLVPRIHCVAFKKLTHNNPLVEGINISSEQAQLIKKELLILLTQLMCGDQLAAEYLIYHLISEVYLRKDCMALGKFSLNISNVPNFENFDFVQEIYKFIEILVPKSHYLEMSLKNMNELAFVPKKDYLCNRLTSSILQLSANTHLVLDETKLSPGKLNEAGVDGVKAIANAIKTQKTMYDFTYYKIEFDCDIPFLIFSEGKSMLPSDCHVVLEPEEMHLNTFSEIVDAARHFLKPELLREARIYLTQSRLVKYEICDNVQELVQNEFVKMRQNGCVSADDLHNLLVLARLVCISQGKNILDADCWKRACDLEQARKDRIKKFQQ